MLFWMKNQIMATMLLGSSMMCFGQSLTSDLVLLGRLNTYQKQKVTYPMALSNQNELQILLSGLFLGYKSLVSSQDGSSCAFHLTCSEYALVAIKRQGLIVGSINFFDRFSRCNTCTPGLYTRNAQTQRFNDTVR